MKINIPAIALDSLSPVPLLAKIMAKKPIIRFPIVKAFGIIARLEAPPRWSRSDGEARGAFGPPDNITDYGDYVHMVASRYRDRIRFYQIWNEPNIYPEWGNQKVDPVG